MPGVPSLFEMMCVYQAIANRGIDMEPKYLARIEDRDGKVLYESPADKQGEAVFHPENAEMMIEMLRGVVNNGTARALRNEYRIVADVAGKTRTTQNYTYGWFIDFTPNLVAGVWVGGDLQNLRFRSMEYGQGSVMAMPIWSDLMSKTFSDVHWADLQDEKFEISDSELNTY